MTGYLRHLPDQRLGLSALVKLLLARPAAGAEVVVPGPVLSRELAPPAPGLIDDFVRFIGGDPAHYRGFVPPPLFCQWSLPLMLEVAAQLPYPKTKVINAGSELRVQGQLERGQPLQASAQLLAREESERRVKLTIRIVTGTRAVPEALSADLSVLVPRASGSGSAPETRDAAPRHERTPKALVPALARELGHYRLSDRAGADFAQLTGDFNPIHWLRPYARAVGFRGKILHGFAAFAFVFDGLVRGRFAGDVRRLSRLQLAFTRPLVLPGAAGVYVAGASEVYFGDAPGGGAYAAGQYSATGEAGESQ